jgi:hypothetical protein
MDFGIVNVTAPTPWITAEEYQEITGEQHVK